MTAVKKKPHLPTVCFGIPECRDTVYARMVAESLDTDHYHYQIEPQHHILAASDILQAAEGMILPYHLHAHHLMSCIRNETGIRVFLSGFAGDLILGGSFCFSEVLAAKNAGDVIQFTRGHNYTQVKPHMEAELFTSKVFPMIKGLNQEILSKVWQRSRGDNLANRHEHFSLITRVRRFTQLGLAAMADFFTLRLPFYDNDFIDYLMQVPVKLRQSHRIYLQVMRLINPEMLEIPYQKTGKLPDGRVIPPKLNEKYHLTSLQKSFVDYARWSRKLNQGYFRE